MTATEPSITIHQQAPAGPPCSFPLPNRCPGCGYTLAGVRLLQCPECGRGIVSEDAVGEARRQVYTKLGAQIARTVFILHGLLWVNHILQGMISAWIVLPTEFIERPALGYAIGIGLITTTFTIGAWAVTRVRAAVRRPLLYVWWLSVSWMTIPIYVFFYRDFIEISVRYFIGILFPSYMHPIFLMASVAGWVVFPFAVARNLHTCGIDARQPGVALVRRVWTTIWVLLLIPIALYGMFEIIEIIRARSNLNS